MLFILNRFVIGGPATDTVSLAYYLKKDFDILIVYGKKRPDEIEVFFLMEKYQGLNIKEIPSLQRGINPFADVKAYFQLKKIIAAFKPDILHTHGAKPGLLGRVGGRLNKVPVVIHTFHGHFFHSYYNALLSKPIIWIERWLAGLSSKIIATSIQQFQDLVVKYRIAKAGKVEIIHLGIDETFILESSKENRLAFRQKFLLEEDTVAIGIIARITEVKNFNLFTQVVAKILSSVDKKVKFFVIGDGDLKKEVQHQLDLKKIKWCSSSNFSKDCQVIFTSWVTEVFAVIAGLDIVVLTSKNEGTGLSLVEAQFCSKPVVATKVGGVIDSLIDAKTGFFAEPNNPEDFVAKLKILINNPLQRETMGKQAVTFAKDRFSKGAEVKNFLQLYHSLLKDFETNR